MAVVDDRPVLKPQEAAEYLQVSILTLRKEVRRGNLRRLGPSTSVAERSLLVPRPATFALLTISEATIAGVAVRQAM